MSAGEQPPEDGEVRTPHPPDPARLKRSNRRIALALLVVSSLFFAGIFATRYVGDARTGIMILGAGAIVFLLVAIGWSLRR